MNFGGAFSRQIQITRLPDNPQDRCTVVSIAPFEIRDNKVTTFPKLPPIPAVEKEGDWTYLVVPATSWFKEQMDGPILQMYVDSKRTADGLIRDFVNGLPEYIPDISEPGLFRCYGEHNRDTIKSYRDPESGKMFAQLLDAARSRQKYWFQALVRRADADWTRYMGNPMVISRDARIAAERLGYRDKPWMGDLRQAQMSNCKFCGFSINEIYPICPNCKNIVNKEQAKILGLSNA